MQFLIYNVFRVTDDGDGHPVFNLKACCVDMKCALRKVEALLENTPKEMVTKNSDFVNGYTIGYRDEYCEYDTIGMGMVGFLIETMQIEF